MGYTVQGVAELDTTEVTAHTHIVSLDSAPLITFSTESLYPAFKLTFYFGGENICLFVFSIMYISA